MPLEPYKKLVISEIRQETSEVKIFQFDKNAVNDISYKAGQYITFIFHHTEKEARRSYSIAASPVIQEPLSIGVKRIPNGRFSRELFDYAKPGDALLTMGAGGVFTYPSDIHSYDQVFFFAAGSGIIPIYSLIKTALYSYPHIELVLIYSNSSIEKTIFYTSLNELKQKFPKNLHIEFLFSNASNLLKAHLHADLIKLYLELLSKGQYNRSLYYICGPEAYMRLCTFTLQGLYIPADQIKKEIFYAAQQTSKLAPPDINPHNVSILYNGKEHTLPVQYPTTILQAAKNKGLILPYSCEVGRCGNCIAYCDKGKVWMSYNEVLTDKEISSGMILTCTAYPVEGDAEVRFEELHKPV